MTSARQWIPAGFGGPEVLQLREVNVPGPGDDRDPRLRDEAGRLQALLIRPLIAQKPTVAA